jgi:hypothetical protein
MLDARQLPALAEVAEGLALANGRRWRWAGPVAIEPAGSFALVSSSARSPRTGARRWRWRCDGPVASSRVASSPASSPPTGMIGRPCRAHQARPRPGGAIERRDRRRPGGGGGAGIRGSTAPDRSRTGFMAYWRASSNTSPCLPRWPAGRARPDTNRRPSSRSSRARFSDSSPAAGAAGCRFVAPRSPWRCRSGRGGAWGGWCGTGGPCHPRTRGGSVKFFVSGP